MLKLPVYNQGAAEWRDMKMSPSDCTLGRYGCYTTSLAMRLANCAIDLNPGQVCKKLSENGGYSTDGLLQYDGLIKAFPQLYFLERVDTTNCPLNNWVKVSPETAIANCMSLLKLGQPPILCVDNLGNDGIPDHAVLLVDTDWTIYDPDGGRVIKFQDRYGDPLKKLYGYVATLGPAIEFPDNGYPDAGQCVASLIKARKGQNVALSVKEALEHLVRLK